MAVHPGPAAVQEDRPAVSAADGAVDCPAYCGWQGDEDDLGSFAAYVKDPVTVLIAEVFDAGSGGFEDPQPQQSGHGYQGEVVVVAGLAGCGEQGFELQVRESGRG
jgi:hypothetical protein